MNTKAQQIKSQHSDTCWGVAFENLLDNLQSDGKSTEIHLDDDMTEWNLPAGEIVATWLQDGTATCYCDH